MRTRSLLLGLVTALAACADIPPAVPPIVPPGPRPASSKAPAPAPAPSAQKLDADTPKTTTLGASFIAPAGWAITVRGPATIVEAPEGDSRIVLVDVPTKDAKDADAALAASWATYKSEARWPLKVANAS